MSDFPPTFVCFSSDQQDEESSCLSQPSFDDESESPSHPIDRGIKLSADPYFFYTLDKRHSEKTEKQELMELRLQVARQQEKISRLESKLSQALVENEELKAAKSTMAEQLTNSIQGQSSALRRRSSQLTASSSTSCQQVVNGVMRKSFQKYIKDSRRQSLVDKETIDKLQQENEALKHQLASTVPQTMTTVPLKVSPAAQKKLVKQGSSRTIDTENESTFRSSCHTDQSSWFVREMAEEDEHEEELDCGDLFTDECLVTKLFSVRDRKHSVTNDDNCTTKRELYNTKGIS